MSMRHVLSLVVSVCSILGGAIVLGADRTVGPSDDDVRSFWSFQPVRRVVPPAVSDEEWSRNPIDRFILAELDRNGLKPAPPAGRRDLVRRVYFDLTGLPPSPEEVEAFVADESPQAYARVIDRLLNSPHYGERWGQHWLDVVRFAESEGFEYDRHIPGLWRYRDYVIAAFNDDKPYDQFILEQLAGDEIASATEDETPLIAAGFHRLGSVRRNAGNQEVASSRNEVLTERTDIVGAAFLGMSVGCARCHDHKFDPIPQRDYYQLQAFLSATREDNRVTADPETQQAWKARTEPLEKKIKQVKTKLETATGEEEKQLQSKLAVLQEQLPPPLPTIATIRNDKEPTVIHVLNRGEWEKKGDRVGMRGLSALSPADAAAFPLEVDRPKSRLARWIADADNPLTARVLVNRIWLHHFGQALVRTPNDFGVNGDRPSHPELLDALAAALMDGDWRIKPIHRLILTSRTYQQASRSPHAKRAREIDPDNRLLWRFNRRRLDAEEIRDAMLAVAGRLNRRVGGESVIVTVDPELVDLLYKPSQWEVTPDRYEHDRRSIYLMAKRNLQLPFLEVFDRPKLQTSCPQREASTHAPQALELLNGPLSNDLAATLAERLRREAGTNPAALVDRAFRLAVSRPPNDQEFHVASAFLANHSLREFALATFNLNAFLYVN